MASLGASTYPADRPSKQVPLHSKKDGVAVLLNISQGGNTLIFSFISPTCKLTQYSCTVNLLPPRGASVPLTGLANCLSVPESTQVHILSDLGSHLTLAFLSHHAAHQRLMFRMFISVCVL